MRFSSLAAVAAVVGVMISPGSADASGVVMRAFALPAAVSSSAGAMQDAVVAGLDGQEWFAVNPGEDNVDYRLVEVSASGAFTVLPADLGATGETTGIGELIADGDAVWALSKANFVVRINAAGQLAGDEVDIQGDGIFDMALAPDGDVYLTQDAGRIDRIVPGTDAMTTSYAPTGAPDEIVAAGDRMFFADDAEGALYSFTSDGTFTGYDASVGTRAHAMVAGPDGDLWAVSHGVNGDAGTSIERIDPATGAVLGTYTPPNAPYLLSIAAGPDGRLWFPEAGLVHAIGALDPATGAFSTYALPANFNVTVAETQNSDNNPPVTDDSTIAPGAGETIWVTGQTSDGAPAIAEISGLGATTTTGSPGSGSLGSGSSSSRPSGGGSSGSGTTTTPGTATATTRVIGRVGPRGLLTLRVTCAGHGTCRGRLTVTYAFTTRIRRGRQTASRYISLILATARYRVGAGQHRTLRLRLSRRGMQLIDATRHGRLAATLHLVPSAGPAQSSSLVLTA